MEPNFEYHAEIKKGLSYIFGQTKQSAIILDPDIRKMISLIPITPNGLTLLNGIMGIGKGISTYAIQKVFFSNEKVGLLQCNPEKRAEESLYNTDVSSTTSYNYTNELLKSTDQTFNFSSSATDFVTQPVKFANEINRAPKSLQDTLLRLFQEYELEYKGIHKSAVPFIAMFDQNPEHMQNDGRSLEPALNDRVDITLPMPAPTLFTIMTTQTIKTSTKTDDILPSLLTYDEMKFVFEDVEKVQVLPSDIHLLAALTQMFFACTHRKDIANESFLDNVDCAGCNFDNGLCKHVKFPLGQRFIESTIKFAKSMAWLDHRTHVTHEDLMFLLPFTLGHRIILQPEIMATYPDAYTWIKTHAMPKLEQQTPICKEALAIYLNLSTQPTKKLYDTLFEKARNNLLHVTILARILETQVIRSEEAKNKTLDVMESKPTAAQVENLKKYLDKNGILAIPNDKGIVAKVLNDATSSEMPEKNYAIILSNQEKILKLLELQEGINEKTLNFARADYAKTVYPILTGKCPASKMDILQKSLTVDISIKIRSVNLEITHVSGDEVSVHMTSKNSDHLVELVELIEP
jgi:MoxR-like ATPase